MGSWNSGGCALKIKQEGVSGDVTVSGGEEEEG